MKPEVRVRPMNESDLPFADSLRELAGWNQTLVDWRRMLALSPSSQSASVETCAPQSGCFVAEWEGVLVGTVTILCYGKELAWIGMLLVHPESRGRGIGQTLLHHCLDHLRACH